MPTSCEVGQWVTPKCKNIISNIHKKAKLFISLTHHPMKKYLALGLISSLLLTSCSVDWNDAKEKKIGELERQIVNNNLNLQEKCSKKTKEYFDSQWFNSKDGDIYENHYNNYLGKCFIKITSSSYSEKDKSTFITISVIDVYEWKIYGNRSWDSGSSKESFLIMQLNFDEEMKEFMEN